MAPQEFIGVLQENNQLPGMIGEVARSKSILFVLDKAEVVDTNGDAVDISEFTVAVQRAKDKAAAAEAEASADAVESEEVASDEVKDDEAK